MFFCSNIASQPNDRWKAGSARILENEVQALFCFVDTETRSWTWQEKNETLQSMTRAQEWLMAQASLWDVPLSFSQVDLLQGKTLVMSDDFFGTGSGSERVDWVSQVVKKAGYRNARQAYRKLVKKYHNSTTYLIIFVKSDGISYAMRFAQGMNKKQYFMEGILLFEHYDNGAEMPVSAIIAHETLHLFGAWDLYTTYAQTIERHAKASEIYPNDIMLRVGNDLEILKVDKLTAWLLGWNPNQEDLFEWFRPKDFKVD